MNKKTRLEIHTIANSHKRRPYASRIAMVLPEGLEYGFDGETSLLLDEPYIVRIKPIEKKKEGSNQQKLNVIVEGFATACEAEKMGLKLSLALLWSAISRKWPLKLDYHTPQPCMVFDRNQNRGGLSFGINASMTVRSGASQVTDLIKQILSKQLEFDPKLLISMELFTSARLETTERAKFIGLVSSLEPLAIPESYNNKDLEGLVSSFLSDLDKVTISEKMKSSIKSRANTLKSESISQAITRFVSGFFDQNSEAIVIVKEVYNIRSNILHEGIFDADLEEKSNKLEDVIRHIYSQLLHLELIFPANIENQE